LYYSLNIIQVIKLRRMIWLAHVALWVAGEIYEGFCGETSGERGHLEHPGIDGKIRLKWIFKTWDDGQGLA
jgi:hypothetical protein